MKCIKAGFHQRRSRNQKRRAIRSSENQTASAYNSVAYDLVKTALSESQAEAEE